MLLKIWYSKNFKMHQSRSHQKPLKIQTPQINITQWVTTHFAIPASLKVIIIQPNKVQVNIHQVQRRINQNGNNVEQAIMFLHLPILVQYGGPYRESSAATVVFSFLYFSYHFLRRTNFFPLLRIHFNLPILSFTPHLLLCF